MGKKKKKEKPILSKEEKAAKKAIKKKRHQERVKIKRERKESNRRKRQEEDGEEALERSTPSKKRKKSNPRSTNESPTSKKRKAEKKKSKKLKKVQELRKPLILTKKEQRKVNRLKRKKILAWWDYENLPYPNGRAAFKMIEKKLRREGYTGKLELHAIVGYKSDPQPTKSKTFTMHYGDLGPRPKVGTKGDQKADNHMYSMIDKFLEDEEKAPQNTLLITNDNGFREKMDLLRKAGHVVLLATTQESLIITEGSHKVWNWESEIVQED